LHTLNPLAQTCKEPHNFKIDAIIVVIMCLGLTFTGRMLCL